MGEFKDEIVRKINGKLNDIKELYYELYDINKYYFGMSLADLERQIRVMYRLLYKGDIKKQYFFRMLFNDEFRNMVKFFNERCPAYEYYYDEDVIEKDNKKFTGEYDGQKYYNGIPYENFSNEYIEDMEAYERRKNK